MKVLVLGASGFIGFATANAFVRAGHIVYGQTRSRSTGDSELAPNEILPVICDPYEKNTADIWLSVAKDCDVLVDCLAAAGAEKALEIHQSWLEVVKTRPVWSPRPTYIYTAGHWVFARGLGGLEKWTDERRPALAEFNHSTIWRTKVFDQILNNEKINGIVVAPTCLYGRSGSFFAEHHFKKAYEATKKGGDEVFETIFGEGSRLSTIHTDDLADLYLRVAERAPICRGQVFLGANPATESLREVLDNLVRVSGAKGWKTRAPEDPYEKAWLSTLLAKPSLGEALAGWTPRRLSLIDGLDVYWAAFVANQKLSESAGH